ncbi:hypothetical protein JM946_08830 [Steroidobacter sp. S1-65]|uniref:DUF3014 domain-containing protein n=1 Tax=Steroidobacter gossypii TaxID=2805490 RepID=A0ABS1WV54_9GAMM|nr:hypothetical protein [Steroidobacter gossypii]MBM0104851.1 hypothetical protein [Steroidobacter gossypii]
MKGMRLFSLLLSIVLLPWNPAAAAAGKAEIKRIYVGAVELPPKPDIVGGGGVAAALLGGPLGAFLAESKTTDIEAAYAKLLADNNIDVAANVAFEAMELLTAKGYEVVGSEEQADATLTVRIQNYGLVPFPDDFDKKVPILDANVMLENREGKRVYRKLTLSQLKKHVWRNLDARPIEEFFNDTKFLSEQLRKINTLVLTDALEKL